MDLVCDDFLKGQLKLYQPVNGPRYTMDTLALAGFTRAKKTDRVAELCSGTGAASLTLAWRQGCSVWGLEIDRRLVDMSRQSAALNGLDVTFDQGDLCNLASLPANRFHKVMVNPPYEEQGQGMACAQPEFSCARQGSHCSLEQVINAVRRLLVNGGVGTFVMRVNRLVDLLCLCRAKGLEPFELCMLGSKQGKKPYAALVAARRDGGVHLTVRPELWIYDSAGQMTPRFAALYEKEAISWD